MERKSSTSWIQLTPILVSILIGIFCSYLISATLVEIPVTPFPEDPVGSVANAVYFVALAGLGATFLYLLLRRKNHRSITLITLVAMTAAVFMLSLVYLSIVFSSFEIAYADIFVLAISVFITIFADYVVFRRDGELTNLIVLAVGGGLGALLGCSIPTQSAVVILGFLSAYDIFAVYRGPVGKIARAGLERFRGMSFSFRNMQIGLGDLVFYSMLSGHMFSYFGYVPCIASIIGILAGCMLSFKILESRSMFPGLPIPITIGLIAGLLFAIRL